MVQPTLFIAFLAGILSFFSPCILPIVPGFMAFISGSSMEGTAPTKTQTFLSSIFFVLGFSIIFALLGVLLNTALGSSSYAVRLWLGRIGGTLIILFALQVMGLLKIPFLMMDHKIEVKRLRNRYITALLFGASFAVGWSPCVGAILGSVFALAAAQPTIAFGLLLFYAIGLGIPFLVVGFFTDSAILIMKKSRSFLKYFNIVVGTLLLILGILVFTNNLNIISNFFLPAGLIP